MQFYKQAMSYLKRKEKRKERKKEIPISNCFKKNRIFGINKWEQTYKICTLKTVNKVKTTQTCKKDALCSQIRKK